MKYKNLPVILAIVSLGFSPLMALLKLKTPIMFPGT